MGAVDDDAQPFEGHAAREGGLGMLDITAEGIVDTLGLAYFVGGWPDVFYFTPENQAFDLLFDFVVELVAVRPEEFDAIIVIRIVRSGDDDPGIGAKAARDV